MLAYQNEEKNSDNVNPSENQSVSNEEIEKLNEEIKELKRLNAKLHVQTADLSTFFEGEFFETKQLVYIFKN